MKDTFRVLGNLFEKTHGDSIVLSTQAADVNATCQKFLHNVHQLVRDCSDAPLVGKIVKGFEGKIDEDLDTYRDMLANYSEMAVQMPSELEAFHEKVLGTEPWVVWLPTLPSFFLSLVCVVIISEVMYTIMCGTSSGAKCIDHCLRGSACAFVVIVILVTASVFASSLLGTSLSQFCSAPDKNTKRFVAHFANSSMVDDAAKHYMVGQISNPIHQMTNVAKKYITLVDDTFEGIKPAVNLVKGICDNRAGVDVKALARMVVVVLGKAEQLLAGKHLWPFYMDIVRTGMCQDTITSFGITAVFLSIMGMIVFPCSAILAHKFLVQWSNYEDAVKSRDDEDEYQ